MNIHMYICIYMYIRVWGKPVRGEDRAIARQECLDPCHQPCIRLHITPHTRIYIIYVCIYTYVYT